MPPKKIPEAEDRGESAIRNEDSKVIDFDAERRRREQARPDTSTNNDPTEPGSDGGGAQNEPI